MQRPRRKAGPFAFSLALARNHPDKWVDTCTVRRGIDRGTNGRFSSLERGELAQPSILAQVPARASASPLA
jgi:hypothetical protein